MLDTEIDRDIGALCGERMDVLAFCRLAVRSRYIDMNVSTFREVYKASSFPGQSLAKHTSLLIESPV